MFRFHKTYSLFALLLFFIEVVIAFFVRDNFVRPYVGDFLVVILLYCFLQSFVRLSTFTACIVVLLFSYCIETAQYFQLVKLLHLEENKAAKTIIGNSFEWADMLAYTLGILFVLLAETQWNKNMTTRTSTHS